MLCPEVWNLEAPQHRIELYCGKDGVTRKTEAEADKHQGKQLPRTIASHYFNHSVSVTLPNTPNVPESLERIILEDSDYYRVDGLRAAELIDKEFIEAFVKKGELSLVTIGRRVDVDDLAAVLPSGHLSLGLARPSYQSLGLEGRPSYFDRRGPSRYVVRIDLKDDKLSPGKNHYERIRNSLNKLPELEFDVVLAWDPPEGTTCCPSSVAAWFCKRGYAVSLCPQRVKKRTELTAGYVPVLQDGCNYDDFFEWLGLFGIDGDATSQGQEEQGYVSSYRCPKPRERIGQVSHLQCRGLFTRRRLLRVYKQLRDYAAERGDTLPWCSLDVQGFADSPVSWDSKEHGYYTDGDNSYTIVLLPITGAYVLRRCTSSNSKPKIMQ